MKKITIIFLFFMISSLHALEFSIHVNNSKTLNAIYASGDIEHNDTYKLNKFISKLPNKKHTAIYLNSPGGNLFEGIKLGMFFQSNRIKTVIDGDKICASACAIAFIGGTDYKGNKWMSSTTSSKLGFHAFRFSNNLNNSTNDTQKVVAEILRYGKNVKAPMDIFIHNFSTPSNEMYWFSTSELLDLGIKVWDVDKNCFVSECNKKETTVNNKDDEVLFIKKYFNDLKKVSYKETWNMLSLDMRSQIKFDSYVNWWNNKVDYVVLEKIEKLNKNKVNTKLLYHMKNGKKICSNDIFILKESKNILYIDKQISTNCNQKNTQYIKKDIFILNEKENGIKGKILLLEDKALPQGVPNSELNLEESQIEYKPAILKLIDTNNKTLFSYKLKYPIANLEEKKINKRTYYYLNTDQYIGMGSYSGEETLLFQVSKGKLLIQEYYDEELNSFKPVWLYKSLNRSWKTVEMKNKIMFLQVLCSPNLDDEIGTSIITYINYIYENGKWNKYTKKEKGFWEADYPFPDLANFPVRK